MSRPGDWNCKSCQYLNFQRRDTCQRCGEARPAGSGDNYGSSFRPVRGVIGSSSLGFNTGPDVRPGDWYCTISNCGAHNFASRSTSCFKCGATKDESSSSSSSSSSSFDSDNMMRMRGFGFGFGSSNINARSGWKSGDWICTKSGCNEHNFASRMECYKCNAPRDLSSTKTSY